MILINLKNNWRKKRRKKNSLIKRSKRKKKKLSSGKSNGIQPPKIIRNSKLSLLKLSKIHSLISIHTIMVVLGELIRLSTIQEEYSIVLEEEDWMFQ